MANKKRGVDEVAPVPEGVLIEKIGLMKEPFRSYACFSYLFGNRVSEGVGIPKRDIVGYYYYPKKGRRGKELTVRVPKYREHSEGYELEPLKAWQVEYDEKERVLWVKSIPTLKKEKRVRRDVPVIMDGIGEKQFIDILLAYKDSKKADEYLWTFSRKQAYYYFMKGFGIMPHKLRGQRATKDVDKYELDVKELMEKYKWTNAQVAVNYVQKSGRGIIDKMKRKAKENA